MLLQEHVLASSPAIEHNKKTFKIEATSTFTHFPGIFPRPRRTTSDKKTGTSEIAAALKAQKSLKLY